MAFKSGDSIDDKYEVVDRLASGGMGAVYLVRHRHLEQRRVVKVLRPELAGDASVARRFRQEARVATQIKHPNVAILYDYSRLADGSYYMVWEYVDGVDVGTALRRDGPFDAGEAIELAIQALRGLNAIHSVGVIHRDISPDNLLLTDDVRGRQLVKIIDLGLAKDLSSDPELDITKAGTFLGKFRYCSPEQAGALEDGQRLDHRTDLYSLTQVLYEMLTGRLPFESESQHGFALKRLEEDPIPLTDRAPDRTLPEGLQRVVMKGLARRPADRYDDAPGFIAALVGVSDRLESRASPTEGTGASGDTETDNARANASSESGSVDADGDSDTKEEGRRELSKVERAELLEQIEQAGRRVEKISGLREKAAAALDDGRLDEARRLVGELESRKPSGGDELAALKQRLEEAESAARHRQRIEQAETMLEGYLDSRQEALARLALDTLLDLYPNHPRRDDYESWVELLADDEAQEEHAAELFEAAETALARDDVDAARERLGELERFEVADDLVARLVERIEEAERSAQRRRRVDELREAFVDHLDAERHDAAETAIAGLEELGVARVTIDGYRADLDDSRRELEVTQVTSGYEERFEAALEARDWKRARSVARELADELPQSPRPSAMQGEIDRRQQGAEREDALVEGLASFDRYLESDDLSAAETALDVLRQIAPADPRVSRAAERLRRASPSA